MIEERQRQQIVLQQQEEVIPLESSPDSTYRVVAMTISLAPLIVLGIAVISYIALLD